MANYSKPPIAEAILAIGVESRDGVNPDALAAMCEGLESRFPLKRPIFAAAVVANIQDGENITAETSKRSEGWAFASADEKTIWQAKVSGFSFSALHTYESWEMFAGEARRTWDVYRASAVPKRITRAAVRYINHLNLPLPFGDFREYLRAPPEVPPELPQGLSAFFNQIVIPHPALNATLVINQGLMPPAKPDYASVVLDIDLFRDNDLPSDEDSLWRLFAEFHNQKNVAFEASITDRMRELIR